MFSWARAAKNSATAPKTGYRAPGSAASTGAGGGSLARRLEAQWGGWCKSWKEEEEEEEEQQQQQQQQQQHRASDDEAGMGG